MEIQNILLFTDMMERWENDPDTVNRIYSYLNRISLISHEDEDETSRGRVNLMTIHSAKGQNGHCFCRRCEDAIIPHSRAMEENKRTSKKKGGFLCLQ